MKIAVVTGGTKGIGRQIVINLLHRGYYVYTTFAQDKETAVKVMNEFRAISQNISVYQADQSIPGKIEEFSSYVKKSVETVDCIVCNAGMTLRKPAMKITDQEWEIVMRATVNAHFYLIRDLYSLIPNNSRIIFIGSMLGIVPHATSLPYGVTKAALHALAQNLVKEFEGTGTTVNVIAPGFVETEWQKSKSQEIRENIYRKTAIKRFATIEEISSAVEFLMNNEFVNGAIVEINGGYCFK